MAPGFPKIFEEGGFDAVIGNPPYYNTVRRLPVPRSKPGSWEHDELVELVDKRIALAEELGGRPPDYDLSAICTEVAELDRAIDENVYKLFDLDEDDQAMIEAVLGPDDSAE